MAENSKIEWCHHTFNPWRGCTKVSPGCAHCYAETLSHRNPKTLGVWGKGQPRVKAAPAMWNQPLKWDIAAAKAQFDLEVRRRTCGGRPNAPEWQHTRPRVFCASLADWLDDEVPIKWLADLLALIHATPNLDWLLLTKRNQNWKPRLLAVYEHTQDPKLAAFVNAWGARGEPPANVWIGTSVEDQQRAYERIPELLRIPAKVRFLSCEPLLGPLNVLQLGLDDEDNTILFPLAGEVTFEGRNEPMRMKGGGIHWVIAGGESGPHARPMHPNWARSLRDQCAAAGVPFFFKQWGEWTPYIGGNGAFRDGFSDATIVSNGPGPTGVPCYRVGKSRAGRILDDVVHHSFPI